MKKSLQRLRALMYKEMVQLLRDRRLLMLLLLLPMIELFLFVYAVSLTASNLPTVLVDQSLDARSRDFVHALDSSNYFDFKLTAQSEEQAIQQIDSGAAKAAVVIPPDFAADVQSGRGNVLILLDGSDSFAVQSGYGAASAIAQNYSVQLTTEQVQKAGVGILSAGMPMTTSTRVLYNPDMRDLVFILPGIIALIIQFLIVSYTSVAIVREREAGTYEQLLATPARPLEMIVAKMLPALIVVTIDLATVMAVGMLGFGVPFQGSLGLFAGLSLLFVIASMGMGLLISSISRTQRQAQQFSMVLSLFSFLLTGFIYPRVTMPLWTQMIGNLIPLTYYLRIVRGVITKGVGIDILWKDALILSIYAFLALVIAGAVTKKRLD